MYFNLAAFAVVVLVIAIWTTDNAVLIPAVIASGIFIGINNTVTTQAVMTVSPVERPVASSAYSFVRFIGGGLAPYAAGRLVIALNIHVPFYIASGAILLGIVVLATGHRLLDEAERVQAEQVAVHATTGTGAPASGPSTAIIPVEGTAPRTGGRPGQGTILAAIDQTPVARLVTEAAARLALADGQTVCVVHARESATAGDVAVDAEDLDTARDLVRAHLDQLAAHHVRAEGQVLLHAADHGGAGRFIAEYATTIRATTIVVGAPSHGGLPALLDASASQELMRHTSSNVLIVNPAAPALPVTANGPAAVAMAQGSGSGSETS
jgi:nucleotide-binding universal stress UspA family protein